MPGGGRTKDMSLAKIPIAMPVTIRGIRGNSNVACRLMEMGLFDGAHAVVISRAFLGDPIRVRVGDTDLSLRKEEADLVDVSAA
ncbi:MAG: ferrous iron transport protein A [Planctomycetes bacterium]|nr:ferrous iron transport protein A [Planctomycetota bacterium]